MSAFAKLSSRILGDTDAPSGGTGFSARLDGLAAEHPDAPDWRRSIVDLLRLLDLDSSYGARKKLALELGYDEERLLTEGSAEMNLWLRDEVMRRLGEGEVAPPAKGA